VSAICYSRPKVFSEVIVVKSIACGRLPDVRFAPIASEIRHRSEITRRAESGRRARLERGLCRSRWSQSSMCPYRFKGQPAEHAIYQTQPGGSFVSLTFVDGIVTELADIGLLPDDDIFQGR
jgi:hypothetical protein